MSANKPRKKIRKTFTAATLASGWSLPDTFDPSASNNLLFRQEFSAFTGSGPTVDTTLQVTRNDGLTYDVRIAMPQQSAAVSGVRDYWEGTIYQGPPISGTEEMRHPSGSQGGTAVSAGSVVHGPFPARCQIAGTPTWKVVPVVGGSPAAAGFWELEYDSFE
jgi:hypothetical protein